MIVVGAFTVGAVRTTCEVYSGYNVTCTGIRLVSWRARNIIKIIWSDHFPAMPAMPAIMDLVPESLDTTAIPK